MNHSQCRG